MRVLGSLGVTIGLVAVLAVACGDDGAKRTARGEAGAGGEAGELGLAGVPGAAGASGGAAAGGEAGASSGTDSITITEYCAGLNETYYSWLSHCYGEVGYPEEGRAEYVEQGTASCLLIEPSVEAGRLAFDGVAASACLQALDPMVCDGFDFNLFVPACAQITAPLVELGDDCYLSMISHYSNSGASSECIDGYCDMTGQVCPGQCVALKQDDDECVRSSECQPESFCLDGVCTPRSADGEACTGDGCSGDASCIYDAPTASEGTCVPRGELGQACSDTAPCGAGFYCIGDECVSKVGSGESCLTQRNCPGSEFCLDRDGDGPEGSTCGGPGGAGVQCAGDVNCDEDHYCPLFPELQVCTPRTGLNQACSTQQECVLDGWCHLARGECLPKGAAGESCLMDTVLAGDQACQAPLKCMSDGKCHPVGAQGDPCYTVGDASCEPGLYCSRVDFTCQPPVAQGELCNPWSSVSCIAPLACLCDHVDCVTYGGNSNVSDQLHTCLPRRQEGEACLHPNECEPDSACVGDPPVCTAPPAQCLP